MVHLVKKCKLMSGSRRRWANNPYKLFILLREYDAAASAPRSDLCNCKIEFIFFLFPFFSLQKYFIYEIFDAERFIAVAFFRSYERLSPSLTIFVHKSPIIFEENIFKMHFFHSLRLLFVLRAFYALHSIIQYKVVLRVRVPRTNTSYFVWIFRE